MTGSEQDSPHHLMRVLLRYRWHFIIPCFAAALAAMLVGLILPRRYAATAIFERRNDLVMSEMIGRGAPQSFYRLKRTLVEDVRGLPAIEKVIDDLGLIDPGDSDTSRPAVELSRQDLARGIDHRTTVHFDIASPQAERVRVIYSDSDPQRARIVVNQLVRNYIDGARRQIDEALQQASDFFASQADKHRRQSEDLEDQKLRFELTHAADLPKDPHTAADNLARAEARLIQAQQQVDTLQRRITRLDQELTQPSETESPPVVARPNPELQRLDNTISAYIERLELAITVDKMTEQHPTVRMLRRKLTELQRQRQTLPAEVYTEAVIDESARRQSIEQELADARLEHEAKADELVVIESQIKELRRRSATMFPLQAEHRSFDRDIEQARQQMDFWQHRQRRVGEAMTAEQGRRGISMKFLKPCGPIGRASSPDPMQVLIVAVAFGLGCGVVGVLLGQRMDQTFRNVEQARSALPAPMLGAVAEIITERLTRWRSLRTKLLYPCLTAAMVLALAGAAYANYTSLQGPRPAHPPSAQTTDAPPQTPEPSVQPENERHE